MGTFGCQFPPAGFPANPRASMRSKFFNWAQRRSVSVFKIQLQMFLEIGIILFILFCFIFREEMFRENLALLKSDIDRANSLAREANMIAAELSLSRCPITYDVTLQIPAANLRPSKIKVEF